MIEGARRLLGPTLEAGDRSTAALRRLAVARHLGDARVAGPAPPHLAPPLDPQRPPRPAPTPARARGGPALVQNGETVILDNGSTTHQVAMELRQRQNLTIITNDLLIGVLIARQPGNRLHMTGGVLLNSLYTLAGPQAVASFDNLHADWLFMGAEGIHPDSGVTNINVVEIPTKHAMLAAADKVVFVADSSKFGRHAFATVCRLSEATVLITDDELPADDRPAYGDRLRCVPIRPASEKRR